MGASAWPCSGCWAFSAPEELPCGGSSGFLRFAFPQVALEPVSLHLFCPQVYDTPPMAVKGPNGRDPSMDVYDVPPSVEKALPPSNHHAVKSGRRGLEGRGLIICVQRSECDCVWAGDPGLRARGVERPAPPLTGAVTDGDPKRPLHLGVLVREKVPSGLLREALERVPRDVSEVITEFTIEARVLLRVEGG